MFDFLRRWLGGNSGRTGPPDGKMGFQWTPDDFSGLSSALAKEGGPEFVEFCVFQGSCEIDGEVLEKFKAVLAKYPIAGEEEYDYFAVVVRDGLISRGLLPAGDPARYQYKVAQWAPLMAEQ